MSNIPTDAPASHNPTTASVRNAFAVANAEVSALQQQVTGWAPGGGTIGASGETGATGPVGAMGPDGSPGASGASGSGGGAAQWSYARGVSSGGDGGSWTNIPDLSVTFVLSETTPVAAWLDVSVTHTTASGEIYIYLELDGAMTQFGVISGRVHLSGGRVTLSTFWSWPAVSAGSHTINGRWYAPTFSTGSLVGTFRSLLVQH